MPTSAKRILLAFFYPSRRFLTINSETHQRATMPTSEKRTLLAVWLEYRIIDDRIEKYNAYVFIFSK